MNSSSNVAGLQMVMGATLLDDPFAKMDQYFSNSSKKSAIF
jgi:hypothetical protein